MAKHRDAKTHPVWYADQVARGNIREPDPIERDPRLIALTLDEYRMLGTHPYEVPGVVRGTREVKIAHALIGRGLLERDPSTDTLIVRCTTLGEAARMPVTLRLVRLVSVRITELRNEDPEAAQSLERDLTLRALILAAMGDATAKDVARIVLSNRQRW